MMTKPQSILPLTALSIDDFQVYERPPWLTTKRWYLGIPSFCLVVLGMAAFFVLHSTTLYNVTDRKNVVDESLLYLNSTFAFTLLADEYGWYDLSRDFFIMQQGWDVQENQAYCALATAAAILNSLRGMVTLPLDPWYDPHYYATQNGLFNKCTNKNVILRNTTFDGIFAAPFGLSLDQTEALLKCHLPSNGWSVDTRHVDPSIVSIDQMRKELVLSLMSPSSRVLVNFNRAVAN